MHSHRWMEIEEKKDALSYLLSAAEFRNGFGSSPDFSVHGKERIPMAHHGEALP